MTAVVEIEFEYDPEQGSDQAMSNQLALGVLLELAAHVVDSTLPGHGLEELRFGEPLRLDRRLRCVAEVDSEALLVQVRSELDDASQALVHLTANVRPLIEARWQTEIAALSRVNTAIESVPEAVLERGGASGDQEAWLERVAIHDSGVTADIAWRSTDARGYRCHPAIADLGWRLTELWLARCGAAVDLIPGSARAFHVFEAGAFADRLRLVQLRSGTEELQLALIAERQGEPVAVLFGLALQRAAAVGRASSNGHARAAGELKRALEAATPRDRAALCSRYLADLVSELLPERIGVEQMRDVTFRDLGISSARLGALVATLGIALDSRLPLTLPYDHPTVDALVEALLDRTFASPRESARKRPHTPAERPAHDDAIAVIGIGCRLPSGIRGASELWQALREGRDAIGPIPASRAALVPGFQGASWSMGALQDIEHFDAPFFGISDAEAVAMDPQHRLMLEVAWEALEDAGIAPTSLAGSRAGVFASASLYGYSMLLREFDAYTAIGNEPSALAGRLSYFLNLRGPSVCVDTACSSSLVAVCTAADSLRLGSCDLAIVGAVNLLLEPRLTSLLQASAVLSPTGRMRAFDRDADGYVRGEGCGVVVLRRLRDAERLGEEVLAVIPGYAVAHGGRGNGITATSKVAQKDLIELALRDARVAPESVGYVEAHGTATLVGDAAELSALSETYGDVARGEDGLLVGSIKSNIGHLEPAAGIVGFIKAALAVRHGAVPPNLNFNAPCPSLEGTRLEVPTTYRLFPEIGGVRTAAVNSFGISGTYAHVIVQAPPATQPRPRAREPEPILVPVSGRNAAAVRRLAQRYARFVAGGGIPQDLALTAGRYREPMACRAAVVAADSTKLVGALEALGRGELPLANPGARPPVAFLYSGAGGHYAGMGRVLYEREPAFRSALEACDAVVFPKLGVRVASLLYGTSQEQALMSSARYEHTATVALQYAIGQVWKQWGIEPDYVLGHSMGEVGAALAASILTLEDALELVIERARCFEQTPVGAMVAINAPAARVEAMLDGFAGAVSIAAINAPDQVVASGRPEAIDRLCGQLQASGVRMHRLSIQRAAHSSLMDGGASALAEAASGLVGAPPRTPIVSSATGELATVEMSASHYWSEQLRRPVQFYRGVQRLLAEGVRVFVEIGPHPLLLGAVAEHLGEGVRGVPSLRRGASDLEQMLVAAGELYAAGVEPDFAALPGARGGQRARIPNYSFERRRYWLRVEPATAALANPRKRGERLAEELRALRHEDRVEAICAALEVELRAVLIGKGRDDASMEGSFAGMGLDSLAYVQLSHRIHALLGISIASSALIDHGFVRPLAEYLARRLVEDADTSAEETELAPQHVLLVDQDVICAKAAD